MLVFRGYKFRLLTSHCKKWIKKVGIKKPIVSEKIFRKKPFNLWYWIDRFTYIHINLLCSYLWVGFIYWYIHIHQNQRIQTHQNYGNILKDPGWNMNQSLISWNTKATPEVCQPNHWVSQLWSFHEFPSCGFLKRSDMCKILQHAIFETLFSNRKTIKKILFQHTRATP